MCTIAVFLVRICATQHGHTKDIVPATRTWESIKEMAAKNRCTCSHGMELVSTIMVME